MFLRGANLTADTENGEKPTNPKPPDHGLTDDATGRLPGSVQKDNAGEHKHSVYELRMSTVPAEGVHGSVDGKHPTAMAETGGVKGAVHDESRPKNYAVTHRAHPSEISSPGHPMIVPMGRKDSAASPISLLAVALSFFMPCSTSFRTLVTAWLASLLAVRAVALTQFTQNARPNPAAAIMAPTV